MAEKTIYVPGSSVKTHRYGDSNTCQSCGTDLRDAVLNVSFKVAEFSQFMSEHSNQGGYINLQMRLRDHPSEYGHTHSVSLNTWTPKQRESAPVAGNVSEDDIPF